MQNVKMIEVPRKDERISVPVDSELYDWLKQLADQQDRPIARQAATLLKAARKLMDDGYRLVDGEFRKID